MIVVDPQSTDPQLWLPPTDRIHGAPAFVQVRDESQASPPLEIALSDGDDSNIAMKVSIPIELWSEKHEAEFRSLAAKVALGKSTPQQNARLEALQNDRRRLKHPRTANEIAWEFKQRRLTQNLVEALQEYVQFHSAARDPWAFAKEIV